jgi:hypothetical protein
MCAWPLHLCITQQAEPQCSAGGACWCNGYFYPCCSRNDVDIGVWLPACLAIATAGFSGGDEQQEPDPTGTAGSSQAPHAHTGPAFAFDYSQQSAKQQQTDLDGTAAQLPLQGSQAAAYLPPFSGIPPHLADHLPDNEKIHKVCSYSAMCRALLNTHYCMLL